ncbi:hypothetical protein PIB30_079146, partial [Stylosanthes scabra]|nr:hypothetical protein [Stylosanthes scabra]
RGFAGGGISKSSRRRHLKEVFYVDRGSSSLNFSEITFRKEDTKGVLVGHDDLVVITTVLQTQTSIALLLTKEARVISSSRLHLTS